MVLVQGVIVLVKPVQAFGLIKLQDGCNALSAISGSHIRAHAAT